MTTGSTLVSSSKASPGRAASGTGRFSSCADRFSKTLSLVLSGEFADEVLQSVFVESVTPAPNASQLLVTVSAADGSEDAVESGLILQKLEQVSGQLRSEVAVAITRRKTPRLMFQVASRCELT